MTVSELPREVVELESGGSRSVLSRLLVELARAPDDGAPAIPLAPGDRVGRYVVEREIGRGGFGCVYAARDPELGRVVAVKCLRPGRTRGELRSEWLHAEAEAIARLEHPGIVTVFDVGTGDCGTYVVMELLHGETLAERLRRGPLSLDAALAVAIDVARALAHAHERGLLHRDLKPGNVLLTSDGRVKLLDFGLAHLVGAPVELRAGTPAYMAPEQARGEPVDARADVYAAAVVLSETLGGTRIPHRLAALLERARSADPADRPSDGMSWRDALLHVARGRALRRARQRATALAAIGVALGLLVAGVGAWRAWRPAALAGPVTLVVADVANETGDPDLDALSGFLVTALEQSRSVQVISRSRMREVLRLAGHEDVEHLDEPSARQAARLGRAGTLLLPAVRRTADTYAVGVRALDVRRDALLFAVEERSRDRSGLIAAIHRVADDALRRLADGPARAQPPEEALTSSLEAYRHYFRALDCLDRAIGFEPCVDELRRSVALDPDFGLAHYQLAQSAQWIGMPLAEVRLELDRAVRHLDHVPARERPKIRALAAQLDGNEDEAATLYLAAAEVAPDDRVLQQVVGDFFLTRNEPERALPFLRRATALSSRPGAPALYLALALEATGRDGELRALAGELERAPPDSTARLGLALARAALGDHRGAISAARQAVDAASEPGERSEAAHWYALLRAMFTPHQAEAQLRRDCTTSGSVALSTALAVTGRMAEAARILAGGARHGCPPQKESSTLARQYWVAELVTGTGDAARTWKHARAAADRNPVLGASLAVYLAYLGDLENAAQLSAPLAARSPRRRVYEAIVRWRAGHTAAARDSLRELWRTSPSTSPPPILPASFVYGELCAELGDDHEAIAALRRFEELFFPIPQFWTWAHPRALYLLARSHERLGETALARERMVELLDLWRDPDPDLPLLPEVRALAARVGATPPPRDRR